MAADEVNAALQAQAYQGFSLPLFQTEAQAREKQVFGVGVVSGGATAQKKGAGCCVEFKVETAIMNRGLGSIRGDFHAGFSGQVAPVGQLAFQRGAELFLSAGEIAFSFFPQAFVHRVIFVDEQGFQTGESLADGRLGLGEMQGAYSCSSRSPWSAVSSLQWLAGCGPRFLCVRERYDEHCPPCFDAGKLRRTAGYDIAENDIAVAAEAGYQYPPKSLKQGAPGGSEFPCQQIEFG